MFSPRSSALRQGLDVSLGLHRFWKKNDENIRVIWGKEGLPRGGLCGVGSESREYLKYF